MGTVQDLPAVPMGTVHRPVAPTEIVPLMIPELTAAALVRTCRARYGSAAAALPTSTLCNAARVWFLIPTTRNSTSRLSMRRWMASGPEIVTLSCRGSAILLSRKSARGRRGRRSCEKVVKRVCAVLDQACQYRFCGPGWFPFDEPTPAKDGCGWWDQIRECRR